MGYRTRYKLYEPLEGSWVRMGHDRLLEIGFEEDSDALWESEVKWYTWQEEVAKISELNPNLPILVTGQGESAEDMWRAFFLNGACVKQAPAFVWPPAPADMLGFSANYTPEPGDW